MSAGGTARQRARGVGDSPDAHWQDLVRISGGTHRADLTRRAVDLAPATIDWLEHAGFAFADDCPRIVYGHEPYSVARTYYGVDEARSLLALLVPMIESYAARGSIDLRLDTTATRLHVADGMVAGVVVDGSDGERTIHARAVVLATGGFGADGALFTEIEQRPLVSAAAETSTGDGLRMACAVGAGVMGRGQYLPTFGGLPHPDRDDRAQWTDRPLLVASERTPWEIYVGRHGRRFVAEDEPSMDVKERRLADLPDLTFFQVFDDRAVTESPNIVVGWSGDRLRRNANRRRGIVAASTIEALAAGAGIDAGALADTVARYNRDVAARHDPEFGRQALPAPITEPPFYALENHGITLVTFAGVDVDGDLRVRREDGGVIPNLYAVGEVLGAGAFMGNSFCGGMAVGPAVTLGRWLGAALAGRAS